MRIQILDPLLANQIAAGEVVERPASVLKELLENSIDAGATQIKIDLEGGGIKGIVVTDNGRGITKEDLPLAFSRHATSKIVCMQDLENVNSLGFRGEALASISSVARVRLASKTNAQETGWEIAMEGRIGEYKMVPCPHPIGTTIEVQDLFFNTPARRKFLRTERTELLQIEEVLRRLLFSRFNINFQVKHQQKILFNVPEALTRDEKEKRIGLICGQEFVSQSIAIEASTFDLAISGWISLPQFSRSQPDMQYFYVNGRIVRDKLINHAVRLAYQDVLYGNRCPGYILFFNLPPDLVDVNVHPTKHEVRFRDSRLVHDFITSTLKESLQQITPQQIVQKTHYFVKPLPQQTPLEMKEDVAVYPIVQSAEKQVTKIEPFAAVVSQPLISLGFALGQLLGIYIVAENEAGMILVDMHAAHERVLYEKLKLQYQANEIVTQRLLVPITIQVNKKEADYVEDKHALFADLGFELARLSNETVVLRQVPALLQSKDVGRMVKDILSDEIEMDRSDRVHHYQNEILATIACRAAVRANTLLTVHEMNGLLRDLENTPNNGVCNHGRPTWQQFTLSDLDKFFLRGK
ncbi:MAG: DNA mismatch repair endonuclease MutL [Gammaproteobacteria bacterium]|nr:DNA mismatch repair endonuclease MutL [Gammaproteobacteria bacterium]